MGDENEKFKEEMKMKNKTVLIEFHDRFTLTKSLEYRFLLFPPPTPTLEGLQPSFWTLYVCISNYVSFIAVRGLLLWWTKTFIQRFSISIPCIRLFGPCNTAGFDFSTIICITPLCIRRMEIPIYSHPTRNPDKYDSEARRVPTSIYEFGSSDDAVRWIPWSGVIAGEEAEEEARQLEDKQAMLIIWVHK